MKNSCDDNHNNFVISCKNVLDKIAPGKKNGARGNRSPFMNKVLSKAIMLRTKLRNTFNEKRKAIICNEIIVLHFCEKVREINNLNEKNICNNMTFQKVVKPLFSDEIVSNKKITLVKWKKLLKPMRKMRKS